MKNFARMRESFSFQATMHKPSNVSQKVYVKKSDNKRSRRTKERKRYVVPTKKENKKSVKHTS